MSVKSFVASLFALPCSLGGDPPTQRDFERNKTLRVIFGAGLLLGGFAMVSFIPAQAVARESLAMSDKLLFLASILFPPLGGVILFGALAQGKGAVQPHRCQQVLAACQRRPEIELYRARVLAQGRPMFDDEASMLLSAERGLSYAEACKGLHGMS